MSSPSMIPNVVDSSSGRASLVAVLYQAIEPPTINGARKPKKPGGYQDSGADIASALNSVENIKIITPTANPLPIQHEGWCFPDTESGILSALSHGATHLWANTILFASHPLQSLSAISAFAKTVRVVGQPALLVDRYDDKAYLNDLLRNHQRGFTLPRSWTLNARSLPDLSTLDLPFPVVGKPVRGRGSHGVKICHDVSSLKSHLEFLAEESPTVMVEEFLAGEEITLTIMPPSLPNRPQHWALPIVTRYNHLDGVAPYNGVVAVTKNSKALEQEIVRADESYAEITQECIDVGHLLQTKALMRIDARRFRKEAGSKFALFDINMKPNMTGPGRPGREDQASLTALAAAALGWSYSDLLQYMLGSACTIDEFRHTQPTLV